MCGYPVKKLILLRERTPPPLILLSQGNKRDIKSSVLRSRRVLFSTRVTIARCVNHVIHSWRRVNWWLSAASNNIDYRLHVKPTACRCSTQTVSTSETRRYTSTWSSEHEPLVIAFVAPLQSCSERLFCSLLDKRPRIVPWQFKSTSELILQSML